MYFSRNNNMNAHTPRYHIEEVVPLSELKIFQLNSKGVGATSSHFVTDDEWNYTMLYMYTNMEEVIPYFEKFDKIYWKRSEQPILKQLDHMREHGIQGGSSFMKWFRTHIIYLLLIFFCNCRVQISLSLLNLYSFLCSVWKIAIYLLTCDI
jgi:hypothetical protein